MFYKRDRLFQVLGAVQIDVQHAENFWMMEERLKKVDTLQKAKEYGQMHERHPLRGLLKPSEEADELSDRFNEVADEEMHEMFDRVSNRIDEMLDEAHSQEQFELMKPGFIEEFSSEICEMAVASDVSLPNLQLFFDMVHLEMEEKIQEHEMGIAENEDAHMDLLRPEHIKTLMLVKIRAFGVMIKQCREKTSEMYAKKQKPKED